jgi:membrane associated rhomboid family serine protease
VEEALIFSPEHILARKEFYRLFTSGFIHANWFHLGMNMYTLFMFGRLIELNYGEASLTLIYLSSIIGGSLLSLFIHRHHDYRAYGASGGVCGVLFAYIFLFPGTSLMMLPLPVAIPSWLYAILFIVGSAYGLWRQGHPAGSGTTRPGPNIGHDAQIGGAIIGLLVTTALYPEIVPPSRYLYITILGLSVIVFLVLALNPLGLPLSSFIEMSPRRSSRDRPPRHAPPPAFDLDAILDKISRSGLESLTKEEHEFLKRASTKPK